MKYRRKISAIIVALILCVTMTFSFANVFAVSEGGSADLGSEKEPQQNEVTLENQPAEAKQAQESDGSKNSTKEDHSRADSANDSAAKGSGEKDSDSKSAYTKSPKAKSADKAGTKIKSQPSVKGSIAGNDRVWATSDTPARTVNTAYMFDGCQEAIYYYKFEYAGLESEGKYNVKVSFRKDNTSHSTSIGPLVASESGSGTWESDFFGEKLGFFFWNYDCTGKWKASFEVIPEDENGEKILINAPEGDNSLTLDIRGIASMELNGDFSVSLNGMQYFVINMDSEQDNSEQIEKVIQKVTLKGLEPNKEYTATGVLSKGAGYYSYLSNITPSSSQPKITDSNGTVTFEIPHSINPKLLDDNYYFTALVSVRQTDSNKTDKTKYDFYPSQLHERVLSNQNSFYKVYDVAPTEEPNYVDVMIKNKIAGTDSLLQGAKLKLIKGKDPAGTQVVDSWTQGEKEHSLKIEPGDYVLVQESVPDDYILHQPIALTVSENDVEVKGYAFEASYKSEKDEDGTMVIPMFVRKNFSQEEGTVVFCVNKDQPFGERVDVYYNRLLYYREYNLTDAILNDVIANPRLPVDKLKEKLLKVVYAGYPNNKAGLKEKYSLTASDMENITQCAIHYYTDSIDYSLGSDGIETQAQYDALQELINTDIEVPKGMSVKIYIPEDDDNGDESYIPARTRFQNLISTSFDKEDKTVVLELANEKKQQPEEPKKPPQPNLSVKKVSSLKKAAIGDIVPYTITVTNSGDGDAKGINVKDIMGDDLEYVSDNNSGVHSGQNVDWVIDVPAGKCKVIKLNCRVKESARNKVINNVVITDPENPGEYQEYKDNVALPLSPPPKDKQAKGKKKVSKDKKTTVRAAATGDDFALGLWAGLAAFSLIVLGAGICMRKSR